MTRLWIGLFVTLITFGQAAAETTYTAPSGAFSLTLPSGWEVEHSGELPLYTITDGESSFFFHYFPAEPGEDLDELFTTPRSQLLAAINQGSPEEEFQAVIGAERLQTTDGHAAKFGGYSGTVKIPDVGTVPMYGVAGAAKLARGDVYAFAVSGEEGFQQMAEAFKEMLLSLREPAEQSFREPNGRFTMAVDPQWHFAERPNPDIYQFKSPEGALFQLQYFPAVEEVSTAFALTRNNLREALNNATLHPQQQPQDLQVGEREGRWGLYSVEFPVSGGTVTLYGHVGAVELGGQTAGMMTMLSQGWLDRHGEAIRAMFTSLSSVESSGEEPWVYQGQDYRMTVPGHWDPIPWPATEESDVHIAHFAVDDRGGKVAAFCYPPASGLWGYSLKSIASTADEELKLMLSASERLSRETRQLGPGQARLSRYESINVLAGVQLVARATAISLEGPDCWMNVIGYSETGQMEPLEREMLEAVETLR